MGSLSAIDARPDDAGSEKSLRELTYFFVVGLLGFSYFAALTKGLGDGDTSWHLAAGEWIVTHRAIPRTDPFSFTFFGKPWTAHEWLSEVLMYAAYSSGGWPGLLLMFGTIAAGVFVTLTIYVRRWLVFPIALLPVALCFVGMLYHGLARPHLFGWLFLALWLTTLLRARDAGRLPSRWSIILLVIWANLHGSFLLGLALTGAFALEALWEAPPAQRRLVLLEWSKFGLVCFAASIATPHGVEGLLFPVTVSSMKTLSYISEWHPADFSSIGVFEIVLLTGFAFCIYKPVRVPLIRVLMMIGLLHMALAHIRHQAVFFMASCVLLARPAALALGRADDKPNLNYFSHFNLRHAAPVLAVMAALIGGVTVASFTLARVRPDSYGIPQKAIAHIPVGLRNRAVFNEYSFGGTLILSKIRVFIDGRADMYGDAFFENYNKIANELDIATWEATRKRWKIEWTILPPDNALVAYLDKQPEWTRIYADKWAVVQARRDALGAPIKPLP